MKRGLGSLQQEILRYGSERQGGVGGLRATEAPRHQRARRPFTTPAEGVSYGDGTTAAGDGGRRCMLAPALMRRAAERKEGARRLPDRDCRGWPARWT